MTDYLEALIEGQEVESPEHMFSWKKTRLVPVETAAVEAHSDFMDGNPASQEAQAPAEAITLSRAYADRTRNNSGPVSIPSASPRPDGITSSVDVWSAEVELRKLRRAVRVQNVSKSVLTPHSTDLSFFGADGLPGPASIRLGPAGQATLMDTLFARDARRYDGPLRLL